MQKSDDLDRNRLEGLPDTEIPLAGIELAKLMRIKLGSDLPFRFQARGWSMAPFIRNHDVITLISLNGKSPGIGEIVAFTRPGCENLVVHRVVGRQGDLSLIKGDGNDRQNDGWIPNPSLLGKVTRIERYGRKVWLGLGLERYFIAWLSRTHLLFPVRIWFVRWRDFFHNSLHR